MSIWSLLMLSRSAAISGDPSSSCIASTSSLTAAYAVTAFCGLYPWSFRTNSTLRPHTPPAAFLVSQYRVRPCSTALPRPAYGPVRSVSTPSLIVVSVTPGPVRSLPPPAPASVEVFFVAQPVTASAATSAPIAASRVVLDRPAMWFSVHGVSTGMGRLRATVARSRRPTAATPPGSTRSSAIAAAP